MSLCIHRSKKVYGFTLVELMVTVAILAIVTAIALPSFSDFIAKTRVDSEISELHRMLLTARNTAVNSDQNVTICGLNADSECVAGNGWGNEVTIFIDTNNNSELDAGEDVIKVKEAISANDTLQFAEISLVYLPSGRTQNDANGTFVYCPSEDADFSRGIELGRAGRVNTTSDTDNDEKDETRDGSAISCS